MRYLFIALSLALAACGPLNVGAPPAPLAATTIDERALRLALLTHEAMLTLADAGVATGVLKGQRAGEAKRLLELSWGAIRAASAARKAGSATDYATAIDRAEAALKTVRSLVKGG